MQNVQMTYQIPIPLLETYRGDFDFALAHLCNFSLRYGDFYRKATSEGRMVLLDNSIHELGSPLTIDEIVQADAIIGGASFIIPPDWHDEKEKTIEAFEICAERFNVSRLAPVIQGTNIEELQSCYDWYVNAGVQMICLPYKREDRFQIVPRSHIRHHFLSFHVVYEIEQMRAFPNSTCDTGKPFRFAQNNLVLPLTVRHDGTLPKLNMNATYINTDCLEDSLSWIKDACKGVLPK